MEDQNNSAAAAASAANDTQSSASAGRSSTATRLLRYPLRSATKSKDHKTNTTPTSLVVDSSNSKRGRLTSSVSKSVSVLDLSGTEKSGKPPRRLSVPSKANATPAPKSLGNITPISEARAKRSGKSDTPLSDISKSSSRRKFNVLSSASYWLSQIKLSESAAKHSISLGFFKLALAAGCEPIQRMSYELKAYVRRHAISELGEFVKELFESYKISESFEQSQDSVTCSNVPVEGNQSSDDDIHSSSFSIMDAEKLKPRSLDIKADETLEAKKANKGTTQKNEFVTNEATQKEESAKKTKRSVPKSGPSSRSGSEVRGRSIQKKPHKPIKQESAPENNKAKKQGKKSGHEEGPRSSLPEEAPQEDKENMAAAPQMEETSCAEV